MTNFFLSHTRADKPLIRQLGVELQVVGADVFFDEWSIEAGESITGAVEAAIDEYEVFLLGWSTAAAKSLWVTREYRSAVKAFIEEPGRRLIVVMLDDEALPRLVDDLKAVDLRNGDIGRAVEEIMGFRGPRERVKAIQTFLEESGVEVAYFPGYGAAVGCAECGAGLDRLSGWSQVDDSRDDTYAGVKCENCGWTDGGEII